MEELQKDIIEQNMEEERKVFHYTDYNEIIQHLDILKENDIVLVKASNGMKFSNIIKYLKEKDQEEIEKELEQALEQDTNLSTQLNEVQIWRDEKKHDNSLASNIIKMFFNLKAKE